MTTQALVTAIRNQYNSIGDSFFSDDEILNLIYQACLDMCREAKLIERVYTTSTVASQQEYDYPTSTIAIKRIQYDGKKLQPITFREDDAITGLNQSTISTGTPQYYMIWNEVLYLRPIPSTVGTLKIFSVNEPQVLVISSTLEIPSQFHMDLVDYCVAMLALKDANLNVYDRLLVKWEKSKINAKRWAQKRKRTDAFGQVQDDDNLIETYLGVV